MSTETDTEKLIKLLSYERDKFLNERDLAIKERDQLRERVERLEEALDRIRRPVWWMQEDQKRKTGSINGIDGAMAAKLANSPEYLRDIASKALAETEPKGEA